jgi:hypothetical protein
MDDNSRLTVEMFEVEEAPAETASEERSALLNSYEPKFHFSVLNDQEDLTSWKIVDGQYIIPFTSLRFNTLNIGSLKSTLRTQNPKRGNGTFRADLEPSGCNLS